MPVWHRNRQEEWPATREGRPKPNAGRLLGARAYGPTEKCRHVIAERLRRGFVFAAIAAAWTVALRSALRATRGVMAALMALLGTRL